VNREDIRDLLKKVESGTVGVDEAMRSLQHLPFEDIGFAHIDHHRSLRKGFPEVIWGEGKTASQIISIVKRLARTKQSVMVTRVDPRKAASVRRSIGAMKYHPTPGILTLAPQKVKTIGKGVVLVISAGTSDIPVAEEAVITARLMGNHVESLYDVGVAGLHRLIGHKEKITSARVLIVCAGMEGALPSVVSGLVDKPVIAVPTSSGYGTSFGGITPLLAMLNACASGVGVVNIDNGFGAGYLASLINRL
jgi:NCAIR mutase (PurE)-related protein